MMMMMMMCNKKKDCFSICGRKENHFEALVFCFFLDVCAMQGN